MLKGDNISIGNLASFVMYCFMLLGQFMSFDLRRLSKSLLTAEKIFDIIDYTPKTDSNQKGEKIDLQGEIKINNISFDYPSKKDTNVLKNFSLTINKHESVGIVGASGSGKTTVINLIERLYEINDLKDSSITFDGIDLRKIDLRSLHEQIGYVCQEPALFNGSIKDNIIYGVEKYTEDDIKRAIQISKAEFVYDKELFPQGIDTNVGERGVQLSGGQKQRIAIARALIKKPKILILDEATSVLETVAHRLSTIKNSDKIVVLNNGIIEEMGKHEELISLNGTYKKLMERQIDLTI